MLVEEMTEQHMILGRRITELRSLKNMTLDVLGNAAGMDPKYINQLEHGKRNPSLNSIIRLAHALGVQPYKLLINDENHAEK